MAISCKGQPVATSVFCTRTGNNDMKNLLSPRTWASKARVKTDIFGAWNSEAAGDPKDTAGVIDHQVLHPRPP